MLSNYRVIELGMWVAGPAAGGLLADWGADVVKVETPVGDPMRRLFALLAGHGQPESPPFDLDNRGKRSVVIDLARPEGVEVLLALLAEADVFLTNLRPEAVERLGLGPDALAERFPRLVYASVSGYGLERTRDRAGRLRRGRLLGPQRDRLAHGPGRRRPARGALGHGRPRDRLTAVAGILAALLAREQTGRGQLVEISLLRTGIYTVGWDLGIQSRFGKLGSVQPRTTELNPMCNCYQAGDGRWFWLLGVEADRLWPKLCAALERPDLLDDERFATARGRRHHAAELVSELDAIFAGLEPRRAHGRLRPPRRVVGPGQHAGGGAGRSAGHRRRRLRGRAGGGVRPGPSGGGHAGHLPRRRPAGRSAPVPGLGQHTDEVLARAGYGDEARQRLRAAGVVG